MRGAHLRGLNVLLGDDTRHLLRTFQSGCGKLSQLTGGRLPVSHLTLKRIAGRFIQVGSDGSNGAVQAVHLPVPLTEFSVMLRRLLGRCIAARRLADTAQPVR